MRSSSTDSRPERDETPTHHTAWLLPALALVVYALFPTRNFNYADDSLSWANAISRPGGLINSHHLVFEGLRALYSGLDRMAGGRLDPARFLAIYSAVCGAIGLAILYRLLLLARCGRAAVWGTLLAGTTAGYWCYSIVGDVYVPATMFLLAGVYGVASGLTSPHSAGPARIAATALSFVLMMLHHQGYFLTVVGLVPAAFLVRGALRANRIRFGLVVPTLAGLAVLVVYLAVYAAQPNREHGTFVEFASGYAARFPTVPDMKSATVKAVVNAGAGVGRAVLSTNFLFKSRAFADAVQGRFPYRNVYPYPYLVRNLPWPVVGVLGACFLGSLVLLPVLVIRGVVTVLRDCGAALVALMAAIPQVVFAVWWEGVSDEFWIWSTPFVALLATVGAVSFARNGRRMLGALAAFVAVSTFVGSVWLFLDPANDVDHLNDAYLQNLGRRDLVVSLNDIVQDNRMRMAQRRQGFARVELAAPAMFDHRLSLEPLEAGLARTLASGGIVYVDPYVVHPPTSLVKKLMIGDPDFPTERNAVRARLEQVDPARIRWVPLRADVPGYFEP